MPDIGKLLSPKSVAVVGASNDLHGLRGRILETTLRVTTSSGQLSATPTTIHVVWQPAA